MSRDVLKEIKLGMGLIIKEKLQESQPADI
jgi:hypothetical protein